MNFIDHVGGILPFAQSSATLQRLGTMLVHSLWQAMVVAIVLKLILLATDGRRGSRWSTFRYFCCCTSLVLIPAMAIATFLYSYSAPLPPSVGLSHFGVSFTPTFVGPLHVRAESLHRDWHALLGPAIVLWLAGMCVLSAWRAAAWISINRLRRGRPIDSAQWVGKLKSVGQEIGVRRPVLLVSSPRVAVPVVIGVLRPAIIIPLAITNSLSPQQVLAILAHEMAHIRRHDYLINLLQTLVEIGFFYHPATWWISSQIRIEREYCCDEVAAAVCGNRAHYAAALVSLEERRLPGLSLALAASGGNLLRRVRRLVSQRREQTVSRGAGSLAMLSIISLSVAGYAAFSHAHKAHAAPPASTVPSTNPISTRDLGVVEVSQPTTTATGTLVIATTQPEVTGTVTGTLNLAAGTITLVSNYAHTVTVTVGQKGFIEIDGAVGDWTTLRDKLNKLPASERKQTLLTLQAESESLPVSDFIPQEQTARGLVDELGLGDLSVTSAKAPLEKSGEVYVGGDIERAGVYSISARHITVKQMLISAGVNVAQKSDVRIDLTRRTNGVESKPMVHVTLKSLMSGESPDLYLEPYDTLVVSGANATTKQAK